MFAFNIENEENLCRIFDFNIENKGNLCRIFDFNIENKGNLCLLEGFLKLGQLILILILFQTDLYTVL